MDRVFELLKSNGPMISGELARLFETTYGVSNEAARKAISRAKPPVKKFYKIKFDKNQVFCYLDNQYMSEKFMDALLSAISQHSKSIDTYIQAFKSQNGFVSKKILPAFVSSPVGKVKGHRKHSDVLQKLLDAQIIIDYNEDTYMLKQNFCTINNKHRAYGLEIAKKIIINDFSQLARDINLVAYGKGKGLFEYPEFGQFQWAYTAPSYIQPLFSDKKDSPGFVVADVYFGKTATVEAVRFFVDKVNVIRSYKNLPAVLPVFLVDKIEKEALELLKANKVMVAILNNLFNEKYTELLNEIVNIFTNATAIINNNPKELYELFDKITENENRYYQVSGDMFELLVGSHFTFLGCDKLRIKEEIFSEDSKKKKELDLKFFKDGKWIVVECKSGKSKIDDKFVTKWIGDNIPFTRNWILNNEYNERMEFQLWSVGGFTDEALCILEKIEAENKKYTIKHFDRRQMIENAKECGDSYFAEIMNKHFKL